MTKLYSAFLKCENKLEVDWENKCNVLKCTQMKARVEKVDILGWNKYKERNILGTEKLSTGVVEDTSLENMELLYASSWLWSMKEENVISFP